LVDKRKVRRDLADIFSTTAEGVRGKRAVKWNLVDGVYPRSKFDASIAERATAVAAEMKAKLGGEERKGVTLGDLEPNIEDNSRQYKFVKVSWNEETRVAELEVTAPSEDDVKVVEGGTDAIYAAGDQLWALRAYRELDDALLQLRTNHLDVGLVLVRTKGEAKQVLAHDAALTKAVEGGHWFVREVVAHMARVLRRFDLTSRSFFALGDAGTCFVGNLLELALASDRFYLLDDPDNVVHVGLSPLNEGALPMTHGVSRLMVRYYGDTNALEKMLGNYALMEPEEADDAGLATVLLDDIDWDDDVRIAIEERASLSPDALTGMEANLRFPMAENCDSKIFARLTAWQNWIFIRPNATGPEGALSLYGKPARPRFNWQRV
jgi:benzoyl-CoA-dihydrodiol lyase